VLVMPETHHEIVFFEGRVQGVGFRYTVLQVAKEYVVTGFVCNLVDSRVHLEAEGEREEVDAFVSAIEERMHGYIRKTERQSRRRPPEFSGFEIR